jgi:hypothetical protein
LVVARRIEGASAEQLAVIGDDANVLVVDEEGDALVGVLAADTDVVQATQVAERDPA